MIINKPDVKSMDLTEIHAKQPHGSGKHLLHGAGREPYKLLAYLSSAMNNVSILDIGFRFGNSALALSYNSNNQVHAYDISKEYFELCSKISQSNVIFHQENILDDPNWDLFQKYKLISLDIDPHDGILEQRLIDFLDKNKWEGLLVLDDIGPEWPKMFKMWNGLNQTKVNVTDIGHASGTGIISYNTELVLEE